MSLAKIRFKTPAADLKERIKRREGGISAKRRHVPLVSLSVSQHNSLCACGIKGSNELPKAIQSRLIEILDILFDRSEIVPKSHEAQERFGDERCFVIMICIYYHSFTSSFSYHPNLA